MLKPVIDPEKLYRATFIRQYGLCCCNMALVSFRLFCKNLGHLREFFGQMVYRPPWQKISGTPKAKVYKFICPIFRLDKTSLYQGLVLLRVPLGLHVQLTRIPSDKICFISSS